MHIPARLAALAAAFLFVSAPLHAQTTKPYEPQVGQAGKDVIWVPTPDEVVARMLTMAQVGPNDIHYDLGAGDGKIAIAAARRGAKATGIEYNPDMAKFANANAEKQGVAGVGFGKAIIRQADIFATNFSDATVITLYLLPQLNLKLRPTILQMKPGTRVVSHSFTMDDWEPDEVSSMDGRRAYFWMVPAAVHGGWAMDSGGDKLELVFEQRFQKIEGSIGLGHAQGGLRDPLLHGSAISFTFVGNDGVKRDYAGKVNGSRMEGTFKADNGTEGRWSATKK